MYPKEVATMGYLFIFLAVFWNVAKGYSSKRVSGTVQTIWESILFNTARAFACFIFALLFVLLNRIPHVFTITLCEAVIYIISGASMAIFTTTWILALRTDAYMLVSVCSSASFIVPCLCGVFFFNEILSAYKLVAFILIICALYFLLRYNFKLNGKLSTKQILLLILIIVSQGINQTTQKMYSVYVPDKDPGCYTLCMLFVSFLIFITTLPFIKNDTSSNKNHIIKYNLKYILIMGLALFASSYFQTLAAKEVDAFILYPLLSALSLIGSSTMSSLIFKEKMSRDSVIGIVLVFCSLIFSKS